MIPPREILRRIVPFSYLTDSELDRLIEGMEVEIFEEGEEIVRKGKKTRHVYFIYSGRVLLKNDVEERLTKGELFAVTSAVEGVPFSSTAIAEEDTICYLFDGRIFREVMESNTKFRIFFETFAEKRFRELRIDTQVEELLLRPVVELVHRSPITCPPGTPVKDASKTMLEKSVGSLVVVNAGRPVGIFTDTDLKRAVALGRVDGRVEEFMSSNLIASDSRDPVFEAYIKMIEAGVNHLVILNGETLEGVISVKDVLSVFEPFAKVIRIYRRIRRTDDFGEMKELMSSVRAEVRVLAKKNVRFHDLSRMINAIYDQLYIRVIEVLSREFSVGREFSWINMGSSGRKEQVIATDQDNAVICETELPVEFLKEVNSVMEYIGIPKCVAGYMAENWHYSIDEWKKLFEEWFNEPTPKNLRLLTVFLDIRHVFGKETLYSELLDHIFEVKNMQALRFLAYDATSLEPPIGIFGIRDLDKGIDLKKYGIYPIVNAVRVFAIDGEVRETNTLSRLEELRDVLGEKRCEELRESFEFLQDLRLRHQAHRSDNLINQKELEKLDLVILREAFKIIKNFQGFVRKYYGVDAL
ncbi:putative nucleotidyltransferase substrate binding domain-containing protein [Geoglobus sp.]